MNNEKYMQGNPCQFIVHLQHTVLSELQPITGTNHLVFLGGMFLWSIPLLS